MSNKKRNKKRNPLKILTIRDKAFLKNKITFYITGDDYVSMYCLKTKKVVTPTVQQARILEHHAFKWSVLLGVCGRDQNGEEFIKPDYVAANVKYRQAELIDFLEQRHTKLIKSINKNHFVSAVWFASPDRKDWDEKEAFDLATELGAFRYAVDPESKQVYPIQEAS
ncbi:MAG: hypothetical protein ACRBB6_04460 [Neptuniibacter sp.]